VETGSGSENVAEQVDEELDITTPEQAVGPYYQENGENEKSEDNEADQEYETDEQEYEEDNQVYDDVTDDDATETYASYDDLEEEATEETAQYIVADLRDTTDDGQ